MELNLRCYRFAESKFRWSWFSAALAVVLLTPTLLRAQDQSASNSAPDEATVIKAVEAAGGKVYRISAADEDREVSFYLSSKPIGDQQIQNLEVIENVIWVNLANTEISDDGLASLENLPLTKLHLERTSIGDAGLAHIKKLDQLEYLNLYGTKITDAGLEQLKELKNLKKLYVWQTAVTPAGMDQLKQALPDLEIVGEIKFDPVVVDIPAENDQPKAAPAANEPAKSDKEESAPTNDKPQEPAAEKSAGEKPATTSETDP